MSEIEMECLLIQTSVEDHGRIRKHSGIWVFFGKKKKKKNRHCSQKNHMYKYRDKENVCLQVQFGNCIGFTKLKADGKNTLDIKIK